MTAVATPTEPWTENRVAFLDRVLAELQGSLSTTAAMDRLSDGLWWYRVNDPRGWAEWIPEARRHPIAAVVHQDPFTRRSFEKPRGYPGDAALLDLIYYDLGYANVLPLSPIGRRIFWRNRDAPGPRAVRERRDHLAMLLDRTAHRRINASVMAIAAGHLREGLLSRALAAGNLGRVVAFDQDTDSLGEIARTFGDKVETRQGSIRDLIGTADHHERFDLVYAAGLYDYLSDAVAVRLTTSLFEMLAPGGELVLANFTPDVRDAGYMETYMGWSLIYRSPERLADTIAELPASVRSEAAIYFLSRPDICYLSVRRP